MVGIGDGVDDAVGDAIGDAVGAGAGDDVGDREIAPLGFRTWQFTQTVQNTVALAVTTCVRNYIKYQYIIIILTDMWNDSSDQESISYNFYS